MTTFAGAALATLLTIGMPSMSEAATFVYVSDAVDATIDAYVMDAKTGTLTSIGKAEAGKTVMPMAVAPDKGFLYAVVRSQPMRVLTYAIDGKSGALTQKATAPLPDSMPYVSTDRGGRFLFTASYGGDKVAVSPVDEDGLVTAGGDPGAADRPQCPFDPGGPHQPLRLFRHSRRQRGAAVRL
jgi:6-phosphogluconolactonase